MHLALFFHLQRGSRTEWPTAGITAWSGSEQEGVPAGWGVGMLKEARERWGRGGMGGRWPWSRQVKVNTATSCRCFPHHGAEQWDVKFRFYDFLPIPPLPPPPTYLPPTPFFVSLCARAKAPATRC